VHHGVIGAAALAVAGLGLATWTSPLLLGMLAAYLALSYFYSLVLKRYVVLDVLTLALLYTWRILAGAVAIGVFVSAWLLAFSAFMFLSLALVKRCAELVLVAGSGGVSTQGRDYRTADLSVLQPLGIGAALCAAVIFGLYIDTQEAQESYRSPMLLWLVVIGLVYWLGRLWIKTSRGEMRDDPLVYALRDRGSRTTVAVMIGTTVAARLLSHPMFG
jgi:4-hydroxybenzoate polyprenyltransferase